jgi:hypothetical protein
VNLNALLGNFRHQRLCSRDTSTKMRHDQNRRSASGPRQRAAVSQQAILSLSVLNKARQIFCSPRLKLRLKCKLHPTKNRSPIANNSNSTTSVTSTLISEAATAQSCHLQQDLSVNPAKPSSHKCIKLILQRWPVVNALPVPSVGSVGKCGYQRVIVSGDISPFLCLLPAVV